MDMYNIQNQYSEYENRRSKVSDLLKDAGSVLADLNLTQYRENLVKLHNKIESDTFRVLVLGTFKNGKSTFINALLGEEVLPAFSVPCTAVINEIKYGEEKRAVLHFKDPLPAVLPTELAPRALEHMKKYDMKAIPPLDIPYDELEDYVVIPMGKDPKEMLLESPYQKAELFWPLELLRNGVEIIDSPGLNENPERTKVTMEYLRSADAIIMLLIADKACAQNEMDFIRLDLNGNGFEDAFFPVNRFDLIRERERERVKTFVESRVAEYTSHGKNGIFYLSALQALDGKLDGDDELYKKSGVAEFEKALSDFLTRNKGKVKLAQPAKELKRIMNDEALYKYIPMQRRALSTSLEEQKQKYEHEKPKLEQLVQQKNMLRSKLENKIERSRRDFRSCVSRYLSDLADSIPAWIDGYEPVNKVGMIPTKERVGKVSEEISTFVSDKMKVSQQEWRNSVLMPMIEEKCDEIFDSAEADAAQIIREIDVIVRGEKETAEISGVPLWKRVVGAAGGLLLGDIATAFSGGVHGISMQMAKTFAFEFGASFILSLLGLLNPVTIIAVVVSAMFMSGSNAKTESLKKIKESIRNNVLEAIASQKESMIEGVIDNVTSKLLEIVDGIEGGLNTEIAEADNQMKIMIGELNKGKAHVEEKQKLLNACEERIHTINGKLDEIIFQMME